MNYTELFYKLYEWSERHVVSINIDFGIIDSFLFKIYRDDKCISKRISSSDLAFLNPDGIPIILDDMLRELENIHGFKTLQ